MSPQLAALAHFHQMTKQTKAGDIGHCMHPIQTGENRPRRVELGRAGDHCFVITGVQFFLLQCSAVNTDAQRLAEN